MPNNEAGNLMGVQVNHGDRVQLIEAVLSQYRVNTNDRYDLEAGEMFIVSRAYGVSLLVRTVGTKQVRSDNYGGGWTQRQVSFQINREHLAFEDPNYVPPPPPRKLGTMPEGDDLIPISHPGIQWIFNDMGAFAEEQGYCSQYDALCIKLGIPGRPRDFKVVHHVNGFDMMTTVKARSQREANEMVQAAFAKTEVEQVLDSPL
jgi:hypothetical protein